MTSARNVVAALVAVIGLELLAAAWLHRDTVQLERAAETGSPRERALALHVLANRDAPAIFGADDVRALLATGAPVLRELAMTYDFARADGAELQREYVDTHPDDQRARFFYAHRRLPMRRKHVASYFGAPEE